ncbi:phosphotransferase [Streptomyces sp. SID13031]|uniref:phosphotransferase n=1 Tax=Streptomyces sp. SID13031 TaxID=2706046 RepID=UPI0013CAB87B|nr:phosphotransferase [Streptomyces sp. SID13031]NEA30761.1 phosphotransferase [Streptomyces sp. SID13031]
MESLSGTERAIFGDTSVDAIADLLDRYLTRELNSPVTEVLFRAGRVDAVWAVRTGDDQGVIVKAHRQPVDLTARHATATAQRLLADAGFPCPQPASGPDQFEGLVLSAETLMTAGRPGSGRHPSVRRSMAAGLAEHVEILRGHPELTPQVGPGPAWCQYQSGPWPTPHDPIFDFRTTPEGYSWLDSFARTAADRLIRPADHEPIVVGHADWYGGNLRFDGNRLVAAFDWDLVADTEPVIAGLSAAAYTDNGGDVSDLPSPDDVVAFLKDYEAAISRSFSKTQQRVAAAAASWVIAYNARCELSMLVGESQPGSPLELARVHRDRYLELTW